MLVECFQFGLKVCVAKGCAIVGEVALCCYSPICTFGLEYILVVDGMVCIQRDLELNVHEPGGMIDKDCAT